MAGARRRRKIKQGRCKVKNRKSNRIHMKQQGVYSVFESLLAVYSFVFNSRNSFFCLLIHKATFWPHTQADRQTDKRPNQTDAHARALTLHLRLICYHIPGHCTASLPLAIHFMLTQHQSVALPSRSATSIHRRTAYHSHLQGKQTMFVSIPPRRSDHLRRIAPADADARHGATGLLTLSSNVETSATYLSF